MSAYSKHLTLWVLVAGVLGYASSFAFDAAALTAAGDTDPVYGTVLLLKGLFIQSLRMLIAPVVLFSLIAGMIGIRDRTAMKRMGGATLGYYIVTSGIAILIGLAAVLFVHPWTKHGPLPEEGVDAAAETMNYERVAPKRLIDASDDSPVRIIKKFLLRSLQNPFAALADTNILAIVFNALLIGLAIVVFVPPESPLLVFIEHANRIFHGILGWIILFAPVGVFAIVFDFALSTGGSIAKQLGGFAALVFGATLLHGVIVLPLIAYLFGRCSPRRLAIAAGKPMMVAFSTASSAATLPVTMQACEEELDVSPAASSFVCPLGATMNMDGTALFEGIAAVFLAYLYQVDLGAGGVFAIFAMAMISSVGAPGMPSGSMAGMQMVLLAAGIPLEGIGILLVVERPLDTFRTAVNVEGDMVGALVVDRFLNRGRDGDSA